jgi:hypothetical protein
VARLMALASPDPERMMRMPRSVAVSLATAARPSAWTMDVAVESVHEPGNILTSAGRGTNDGGAAGLDFEAAASSSPANRIAQAENARHMAPARIPFAIFLIM